MTEAMPRHKLAAILAAGVVGFNKLMGQSEDRTLKNLKACRTITDTAIEASHGRIFGSAGDSAIAEFASAVDAVLAAVEFQKNILNRNETGSPENIMRFRGGLNLGDVIVEGDNLFGDGVNIAARLEAAAEPGGVTLSSKFHDETCRKLDLIFVSTGFQQMKNIAEPVGTYKIALSDSDVTESSVMEDQGLSATQNKENAKELESSKPPAIAALPFVNKSGYRAACYRLEQQIMARIAQGYQTPILCGSQDTGVS